MQAATQTLQPEWNQTQAAPLTSSRGQRARTIAYWVTTLFGPASFIFGGVVNLMHEPDAIAGLHHLGYPEYFASMLGVSKILGAITVVIPGFPRLKEWAYAGFTFDLLAAAASRAFVGDGLAEGGGVVAPLVFLALVLASWALRPASRKLSACAQTQG